MARQLPRHRRGGRVVGVARRPEVAGAMKARTPFSMDTVPSGNSDPFGVLPAIRNYLVVGKKVPEHFIRAKRGR